MADEWNDDDYGTPWLAMMAEHFDITMEEAAAQLGVPSPCHAAREDLDCVAG